MLCRHLLFLAFLSAPALAHQATEVQNTEAAAVSATNGVVPREELEMKHISFAHGNDEWSGGILGEAGKLWLVADASKARFVYQADISGKRFQAEQKFDLAKFKGFDAYIKTFDEQLKQNPAAKVLDLEGITRCAEILYIINEAPRQVLVVDVRKKTFAVMNIQWSDEQRKMLAEGGINAGFEGIAADCAQGLLYLAKEREPRHIFSVKMDTGAVVDAFDFPVSNRGHQKVINPFTGGDGLMDVGPDMADLFYDEGFLYVLERNSYEVTKVDLKTHLPVARASYFKTEFDLYDSGEPFGEAEVLIMTPEAVIVGFDNNKSPIGSRARQKYKVDGAPGAFAYFKRPKGF